MWEINFSLIPLALLVFVEAFHDYHRDFIVRYIRTIYCKKCAKPIKTISYSWKQDRLSKLIKLFMFILAFLAIILGINYATILAYMGIRFLFFDLISNILIFKTFNFKKFLKSTEYYYWYQILTKQRTL